MKKYLLIIILCISSIYSQSIVRSSPKLRSLVLPGWGEHTLGQQKLAKSYFIREAALWLIYFGSLKKSNWYESDYIAFAEIHADVEMNGKKYLFAVNLGHYDSLEEYNDIKERQRLIDEKYLGEKFSWKWDSEQNRIKFDKMRINSVNYRKYANFSVGGLILHRLISFIDVIYLQQQYPNVSLNSNIDFNNDQIQLKLSLNF